MSVESERHLAARRRKAKAIAAVGKIQQELMGCVGRDGLACGCVGKIVVREDGVKIAFKCGKLVRNERGKPVSARYPTSEDFALCRHRTGATERERGWLPK